MKGRLSWFPLKRIDVGSSYPAWISREDLCACGLRSSRPRTCKPGKHHSRILSGEEVLCLASKGFGVVGSNLAVWDGRFLFAAGSSIKKALLAATVSSVAASRGQNVTDLSPAAQPGKLYLPEASLLHRGSDTVHWKDLDLLASTVYKRPFSEGDLPLHMRSYPLPDVLSELPKAEEFEIDDSKIWKRCSGIVVPAFDLCILSPVTASRERSRRLVGKVAMVFGLFTYKMPPLKRESPVVVVVEPGNSYARVNRGIVYLGEDKVLARDASEGALLHELAHVIEPLLPEDLKKKLKELYQEALPRLRGMAGVVLEDSKPPPQSWQGHDYVYATQEIEFFSTACEAWFNAIPAHLLSAEDSLGIRVTRNRADLFALFPEVATFLSSFLAPYSYSNQELDRSVDAWLKTLPQHEVKKLDDLHDRKRAGTYVDGIINVALQKLWDGWKGVKYFLSDEDL